MTVFSFEKAFAAIESENFTGEEHDIPILPYEDVMEREVDQPGALGPLHTQFDDHSMKLLAEEKKYFIPTEKSLKEKKDLNEKIAASKEATALIDELGEDIY